MLEGRLTLLINTCEAFSDLWDTHFRFLEENWGDRTVKTCLLTDRDTDRTFDGVSVISAGEGKEFPERIAKFIESVDTEYVLITLDDYFPVKRIENEKIERLLDIMDREKIDYIRLFPSPNSHRRYGGHKGLYKVSLDRNYAVNLYQAVWRTSFLKETVGRRRTIWEYEVSLTGCARANGAKCALSKGGEFEILDVIRKGKILHKAKRYLKRRGITLNSREVISRKEEFRIFVFSVGERILPGWAASSVKRVLRKRGVRFFSDGAEKPEPE